MLLICWATAGASGTVVKMWDPDGETIPATCWSTPALKRISMARLSPADRLLMPATAGQAAALVGARPEEELPPYEQCRPDVERKVHVAGGARRKYRLERG